MPRASVCGCVSASPREWTGPAGTPAASRRAIQSARVHLAVPKPSLFVREQKAPTASVSVNLINGRTLDAWLAALEARLDGLAEGRLAAAIDAYFDFAIRHRHAWAALYDFRLPEGEPMPEHYQAKVAAITEVVGVSLKIIFHWAALGWA